MILVIDELLLLLLPSNNLLISATIDLFVSITSAGTTIVLATEILFFDGVMPIVAELPDIVAS